MNKLKALLASLASLWGLLTTASILFPWAASFLDAPIVVENSTLTSFYTLVPSILSAFSLLLLTTFSDSLARLPIARKVSLTNIVLATVFFFLFVGIRSMLLDVSFESNDIDSNSTNRTETQVIKDKGTVVVTKTVETDSGKTETIKKYPDPWDLPTLFCFSGTFCCFTLGFGALGIHYHQTDAKQQGAPN